MKDDRISRMSPDRPIAAELEVMVNAEHVRIVYGHAAYVALGNVLASLTLVFGMAGVVSRTLLLSWLAAVLVVNLARYFLAQQFLARHPDDLEAVIWERIYLAGVVASGLLWGTAAFLFHVSEPLVYGMFAALILVAMGSASVVTHSFHHYAYPLFVTLLGVPLAFRLLQTGGTLHTALGVVTPIYFAMLCLLSNRVFRFVHLSLTAEIRSTKQAMDAYLEGNELFHSLAELTKDAVIMVDKEGKLSSWNLGAERLFGYSKADTYGRAFHALLFAPRHREAAFGKLSDILGTENRSHSSELWRVDALHRDGREFPVEMRLFALRRQGKLHAIGLIRAVTESTSLGQNAGSAEGASDALVQQRSEQLMKLNEQLKHEIYERQRMEKKLELLATHDALTGLFNRNEAERRINKDMALAVRYGHPISFFMVDIDYFKRVNDQYGHQAGDKVLRTLAHTINGTVRNTDYAARYGGEEFVVILPETAVSMAVIIAERLRKAVANLAIEIDGSETLKVTISVGVSAYPENGRTRTDLIKVADSALYTAKEKGRNRVCVAKA